MRRGPSGLLVLVGLFLTQAAALATNHATLSAQYIQQGLMLADNAARSTPDSFTGGTCVGEWCPTVPAGPNGTVPMLLEFLSRWTGPTCCSG